MLVLRQSYWYSRKALISLCTATHEHSLWTIPARMRSLLISSTLHVSICYCLLTSLAKQAAADLPYRIRCRFSSRNWILKTLNCYLTRTMQWLLMMRLRENNKLGPGHIAHQVVKAHNCVTLPKYSRTPALLWILRSSLTQTQCSLARQVAIQPYSFDREMKQAKSKQLDLSPTSHLQTCSIGTRCPSILDR